MVLVGTIGLLGRNRCAEMDVLSNVDAVELERFGRSVGTPQFYKTSLRLVSTLIPGEFESVTVYSKRTRPKLLHFEATPHTGHDHEVAEIVSRYNTAFFRFDPYYRYWREVATPGVVPLYEIPDLLDRDELYVTSYMPAMQMADDVVIFLPVPADRAVALGRERSWRYEKDEINRLKLLYPLLAGLNETHLRVTNISLANEPFLEDDNEVTAPLPLDFSTAVDAFTSSGFTPREREIIRLLLAGFSNSFIAKRLEIGVGTVRNHRKRIYAKLDVTTEREIFSLFIGYLANKDPGSLIE